jgi:hypothetical protein
MGAARPRQVISCQMWEHLRAGVCRAFGVRIDLPIVIFPLVSLLVARAQGVTGDVLFTCRVHVSCDSYPWPGPTCRSDT